jgi:hypothetical protein
MSGIAWMIASAWTADSGCRASRTDFNLGKPDRVTASATCLGHAAAHSVSGSRRLESRKLADGVTDSDDAGLWTSQSDHGRRRAASRPSTGTCNKAASSASWDLQR